MEADMCTELLGKEVATLLTPTTLTLVTARDGEGDCVATCAWVNPLSHEPSLIGVCLRPGGRTAVAIEESGEFCVSVLPVEMKHAALVCGKKGAEQPERFDAAGLERIAAQKVDAVRVAGAVGWIECELVDRRVYGDHELYVGRTLVAQRAGGDPLLMMGRSAFGAFSAK